MADDQYWNFGRKEILCISSGLGIFMLLSLVLRAAPPWWFLPLPGRAARAGFDRWEVYALEGGYGHFWLQSLIGWLIVGAVLGLIFSNVVLRGKAWSDD